jgi:nucleoside-diphosphate-sugar epimerase
VRVLVTGSDGYVGAVLVPYLVRAGHGEGARHVASRYSAPRWRVGKRTPLLDGS